MIFDDDKFKDYFPDANKASFQLDTKWQIINTALSMWLKEQTGILGSRRWVITTAALCHAIRITDCSFNVPPSDLPAN